MNISRDLQIHFRDELRNARLAVLRDAEAFTEVLFALERLGSAVHPRGKSLGNYKDALLRICRQSALVSAYSSGWSIDSLYTHVKDGRNQALHQGAYARNLSDRAVELALILEDGLANGSDRIGEYMVRNPVVAHGWQPLRLVRHNMLAMSFSFLPIEVDQQWKLISDLDVAKVLRVEGHDERADRLAMTVADVMKNHGLRPANAVVVREDESVADLLKHQTLNVPVLVTNEAGMLVGIATPFDLL